MTACRTAAIASCLATALSVTTPASAQTSAVPRAEGGGLLSGLPGFGPERELASAERTGLDASLAQARQAMDVLSADLAGAGLELGQRDAVIGRLFARLETLRRASRVPGAAVTYRLAMHYGPAGADDATGAPGNCAARSDDGQGRFATVATPTHAWSACTSLDASPAPTLATPVLLLRRSTRNGDRNQLGIELGFGYGDTSSALALVHDTAIDIELAMRPLTRQHDRTFRP